MARGTQHKKRRATRTRAQAVATTAPEQRPRRQKPPQWQEQLFFSRLRVHAKWAFVLLALVFAVGFVFFGVGSGSTGISDALQNAFSFGSSGGTSISKLQHSVAKHPQDPKAWRDLATALEQKHRPQEAVAALEHYTALRPKDQGALAELASQYSALASSAASDYTAAQQAAAAQSPPAATFAPPPTSPLGKAFDDPASLKDPISTAVSTLATAKEQTAYAAYQAAQRNAESAYKKLAALTPNDATAQIQLGQAAQAAQDSKTALAAFERFLKLAPTDPLAPQVRQAVKSLRAQVRPATPKGSQG
jgi:cytochrome c-type biogenesis protein CcmH/NrfG